MIRALLISCSAMILTTLLVWHFADGTAFEYAHKVPALEQHRAPASDNDRTIRTLLGGALAGTLVFAAFSFWRIRLEGEHYPKRCGVPPGRMRDDAPVGCDDK